MHLGVAGYSASATSRVEHVSDIDHRPLFYADR
jgi:hypothetical protein